jgi:hypothetical protein
MIWTWASPVTMPQKSAGCLQFWELWTLDMPSSPKTTYHRRNSHWRYSVLTTLTAFSQIFRQSRSYRNLSLKWIQTLGLIWCNRTRSPLAIATPITSSARPQTAALRSSSLLWMTDFKLVELNPKQVPIYQLIKILIKL